MWINKLVYAELRAIEQKYLFPKKEYITYAEYSCEVCGCLVNPTKITRGNAEIRTVPNRMFGARELTKEVLYYPYYCLIHVPQKKEGE